MRLSLIVAVSVMARHLNAAEEDNEDRPIKRLFTPGSGVDTELYQFLPADDLATLRQVQWDNLVGVDEFNTIKVVNQAELETAITKYSSEPGIKYIKFNGKPLMTVKGYSPDLQSDYTGQYDLIETDDWVSPDLGYTLNKVTGEMVGADVQALSPSTFAWKKSKEWVLLKVSEDGMTSFIKSVPIPMVGFLGWKTQFQNENDDFLSLGTLLYHNKKGLFRLNLNDLTEEQIQLENIKEGPVIQAWFSRDSSTMIQRHYDSQQWTTILNVVDTQTGNRKQSIRMNTDIGNVKISSDNQWALVDSFKEAVYLIDLNTGMITEVVMQSDDSVYVDWLESDLFQVWVAEKDPILRDVRAPLTDIPFDRKRGYFHGMSPTYHSAITERGYKKVIWQKREKQALPEGWLDELD